MRSQPELDFSRPPGYSDALARRSDPLSSHAVADAIEANGTKANHEALILWAMRNGEELTAAQIAARVGLEHVQAARRMSAMARRRFVERVATESTDRVRWRLPI